MGGIWLAQLRLDNLKGGLMKKYILGGLLMAQSAFASVHGVESAVFMCSNGGNYDVAIYLDAGLTNTSRALLGLCTRGTLRERFYGWQFPSNIPEVVACERETSDELRRCYFEFVRLNPVNGENVFINPLLNKEGPKYIVQGRR